MVHIPNITVYPQQGLGQYHVIKIQYYFSSETLPAKQEGP